MDRFDRCLFATMVFIAIGYCLLGLVKMAQASDSQVLVIRYFSVEGGPLQAFTASYGWNSEACAARKVVVDKQPDPPGSKTIIDCVEESDLPMLLARGDHI